MADSADGAKRFDLTSLFVPMAGEGLQNSMLQSFWERGGIGEIQNASHFVDQHQFPAYRNVMNSDIRSSFCAHYTQFPEQLKAVREALMKLWVEFHLNPSVIVPEGEADKVWNTKWFKQETVPTGFVNLDDPRYRLRISRFPNSPISALQTEAVQHACNAPVCYNVQLAEAFYGSQTWAVGEQKRHAAHARFIHSVLPQLGDSVHGLYLGKIDSRGRVYEQMRGVGGVQNDKIMQSFLMSGEAMTCCPEEFWAVMEFMYGLTERNYSEILEGNLSAAIDKFGLDQVNGALHCKEFVDTGKTRYLAQYDQSCSGPGFQGLFMRCLETLKLCNLRGKKKRRDAYLKILKKIAKLDPNFRAWLAHRPVGKNLAKGGTYGAGGGVMAFHSLGIDPDESGTLNEAPDDRLEAALNVPEPFWAHPWFEGLLSPETGKLQSGVTLRQLLVPMSRWTKKVGYPALHSALPQIRPYLERVRLMNLHSLRETGEMLSWKSPLGDTIRNNPFVRSSIEFDSLRVSHKGVKDVTAKLSKVTLETERDTAANLTHWYDSFVMARTQLEAKKVDLHIVGNHDSFRINLARKTELMACWDRAYRQCASEFNFSDMCVERGQHPIDGPGNSDLIPEDRCIAPLYL